MRALIQLVVVTLCVACSGRSATTSEPLHPLPASPMVIVVSADELSSHPAPLPVDAPERAASSMAYQITPREEGPGLVDLKEALYTSIDGISVDEATASGRLLVFAPGVPLATLEATIVMGTKSLSDIADIIAVELPLQAPKLPRPHPLPPEASGNLYIENWSEHAEPVTVVVSDVVIRDLPKGETLVIEGLEVGTYLVRLDAVDGTSSERRIAARTGQ